MGISGGSALGHVLEPKLAHDEEVELTRRRNVAKAMERVQRCCVNSTIVRRKPWASCLVSSIWRVCVSKADTRYSERLADSDSRIPLFPLRVGDRPDTRSPKVAPRSYVPRQLELRLPQLCCTLHVPLETPARSVQWKGQTHPNIRSLITIPNNNLTRSFPLPCRARLHNRYAAAMIVEEEMMVPPMALILV